MALTLELLLCVWYPSTNLSYLYFGISISCNYILINYLSKVITVFFTPLHLSNSFSVMLLYRLQLSVHLLFSKKLHILKFGDFEYDLKDEVLQTWKHSLIWGPFFLSQVRYIFIDNGGCLTVNPTTPIIPSCFIITTSSNHVCCFHCFDWETPGSRNYMLWVQARFECRTLEYFNNVVLVLK